MQNPTVFALGLAVLISSPATAQDANRVLDPRVAGLSLSQGDPGLGLQAHFERGTLENRGVQSRNNWGLELGSSGKRLVGDAHLLLGLNDYAVLGGSSAFVEFSGQATDQVYRAGMGMGVSLFFWPGTAALMDVGMYRDRARGINGFSAGAHVHVQKRLSQRLSLSGKGVYLTESPMEVGLPPDGPSTRIQYEVGPTFHSGPIRFEARYIYERRQLKYYDEPHGHPERLIDIDERAEKLKVGVSRVF